MLVSNEPRIKSNSRELGDLLSIYWSKWKDKLCSRFCTILGAVWFLKIHNWKVYREAVRRANILLLENLKNFYNVWQINRYDRKFSGNTFSIRSKWHNFRGDMLYFYGPGEDLVPAMTANLSSTLTVKPLFTAIKRISLEQLSLLEDLRIGAITLPFNLWSGHTVMFKQGISLPQKTILFLL